MTMRGIDISSAQARINLDSIAHEVDFIIIKATEGVGYTNPYAYKWANDCIRLGIAFGFYHYARQNNPANEAEYFLSVIRPYIGQCVFALDWEECQPADWVNSFVDRMHELTGFWPWIYSNPRFFGPEVSQNCKRWIAAYPTPETDLHAPLGAHPSVSGEAIAWQFTSSVRLESYISNLDGNICYTDETKWLDDFATQKEVIDVIPIITQGLFVRFYNPNDNDHVLASKNEVDDLREEGWTDEGLSFVLRPGGTVPCWRLYNPNDGDHYMTTDYTTAHDIDGLGWIADFALMTFETGTPMYGLYDANGGTHHYTTDATERDDLVAKGWRDEGVAFYF